jgi:hypothetical protein
LLWSSCSSSSPSSGTCEGRLVVAVKPMAAPEGGGDKVAERELLTRAGSCVVVCLLKRPKTLVAGITAAGQGSSS